MAGLGIGIVAAAGGGGGAPATGPDSWGLTWEWDGDNSVNTSVTDVWTDQQAGIHLQQATSANRPSYTASDATWNNHGSLTPDGTDYLQIDETQVPRGDQTFFHDNTKSWFAFVVFEADSGSNNVIISNQSSTGLNTGISVITRDSSQGGFLRITQYNGTASDVTQSANNTIRENENNVAFLQYDNATNELGIRVNGGPWVKTTVTQTPDTGNSGAPLTLLAAGDGGNGYDGAITQFSVIEGSLPTEATQQEILDYYLGQTNSGETNTTDGWVAQWPVSADGFAVTAEDVNVSGGNITQWNDQSGNGHHIVQNPLGAVDPAYDNTTYGVPVGDFDGAESMQIPSSYNAAVSGTTDQPLFIAASLRSVNNGDYWLGLGLSASDYTLQLRNKTGDTHNARRDDGPTLKLIGTDAIYPDATWMSLSLNVESGTTGQFYDGVNTPAGGGDLSTGGATSAATDEARLGARAGSSSGESTMQFARGVWDAQDIYGMAAAKLRRWTNWATDNA